MQVCSVVWLQRTVSDQSYRINTSDNVRMKARQRPRSLASVSPLINLSVTWLCNTLKCSWGVSHQHIGKSTHRLCTPISYQVFPTPQQPLCSSLLWRHICCPGMCFSDYAMPFNLYLLPHFRIPVKHRLWGAGRVQGLNICVCDG